MSDCLFCRIGAGEISASIVVETPLTLAFRDIHPQARTHVLVIPKEHIASLTAFKTGHEAVMVDLNRTIQEVARLEKIAGTGFRVVVNNGKDANQTVAHLHYHVMAGRRLGWPPG